MKAWLAVSAAGRGKGLRTEVRHGVQRARRRAGGDLSPRRWGAGRLDPAQCGRVYDHTFGKKTEDDVRRDVDRYITADGQSGQFVAHLKTGPCLVFYTHIQTLYGNGTKSGFQGLSGGRRTLAEAPRRARRVAEPVWISAAVFCPPMP